MDQYESNYNCGIDTMYWLRRDQQLLGSPPPPLLLLFPRTNFITSGVSTVISLAFDWWSCGHVTLYPPMREQYHVCLQ